MAVIVTLGNVCGDLWKGFYVQQENVKF